MTTTTKTTLEVLREARALVAKGQCQNPIEAIGRANRGLGFEHLQLALSLYNRETDLPWIVSRIPSEAVLAAFDRAIARCEREEKARA